MTRRSDADVPVPSPYLIYDLIEVLSALAEDLIPALVCSPYVPMFPRRKEAKVERGRRGTQRGGSEFPALGLPQIEMPLCVADLSLIPAADRCRNVADLSLLSR